MSWVRIDDRLPRHPKFLTLSPAAKWAFIESLCYCNEFLTDGFLSLAVSRRISGRNRVLNELQTSNLWTPVDGGFQVHDYLDYQPSRQQVEQSKVSARTRKERWRNGVVPPFGTASERLPHPNPSQSQSEDRQTDRQPRDEEPPPAPLRRPAGRSSWQAMLGAIALREYGNDIATITPELETKLVEACQNGFSRDDIGSAWAWACRVAKDRTHPEHRFIPRAPSVRQLVNKLDIWFERSVAEEVARGQ